MKRRAFWAGLASFSLDEEQTPAEDRPAEKVLERNLSDIGF
jgi:hypothetical protein